MEKYGEYTIYVKLKGEAMAIVEFDPGDPPVSIPAIKNAVIWALGDTDELYNMTEITEIRKWSPKAQKSLKCNLKDFERV